MIGMTACAQPTAEAANFSDEDAAAVRANIEAYLAADPIASPDEFFSQFSDDVFWGYLADASTVGIEELRDIDWCTALSHENSIDRIEGSGNLAFSYGSFALVLDCGEAQPWEHAGNFLLVHRRQADDSWRIAAYVANH
jgi:ketosteroid isomerase-like protein